MSTIKAKDRLIGTGQPVFIIAEAGVNHNGDIRLAKQLADIAAEAGSDAVKFQTAIPDKVMTRHTPKAEYQKNATGSLESQLEMVKKLHLSFDETQEVAEYCRALGVMFISTPFDFDSANFLETLDVPLFKIPSGEVNNLPFLQHIARKGRPIILSTGMSYLGEVDEAVRTIREEGNNSMALLHCVTSYPAQPCDVNLKTLRIMYEAFELPVGYSDHTIGLEISIAAVALGATIIEKHFTIDRNMPGPDHSASLEPDELANLVKSIRNTELAMGDGMKRPMPGESLNKPVVRRSLVAARDLSAGTKLRREDIEIKRPGTGMAPSFISMLIGRTLRCEVGEDDLFTWEMV